MGRKFLSFLGTGNYNDCCYYYGSKKVNTKYVQRALLDIFCQDWEADDETIIFLTNEAKEKHWDPNLKEELLSQNYPFKIVEKNISIGKNIEEIWDIFKKLLEVLEEKDEVIFDITHAFRSIPMLGLVVLNFAKATKNIKLSGIYYGAYESRNSDNEAPIFDLTEFDKLLEWSYAINSFVHSGESKFIYHIVNNEKKNDNNLKIANKFAKTLKTFTDTIHTCKGIVLDDDEKSVYGSYNKMKEALIELKEKNNLPILDKLFNQIDRKTKIFDGCNDNLSMGINYIKWCIKHDLVQQGYTALNETIKTYICVLNGLDDVNKEYREDVAAKAMAVYRKNEEEWEIKEKYREMIKKVIETTPKELFKIYNSITSSRNDINHFGFTDEKARRKVSVIKKELEKKFKEFEKIVNETSLVVDPQ
ncbi:CRISPR-associated protein, TM1812 family [Anaerobranca californiensis DSM 14826]|jgi:CRISPR-associated Csx2 family protein|uniref:CRISPR-associated protein, TM1812 family n=1 Tax=Anaerobranca californiensis DSM 14826 TaxID=1120989 RepID=A0A1M6QJU1_9FIRM|nr:TIGR02221 family CRISPR-associated protein [Anaerobranca californiensis]SHK20539.1 CRISPR-associated protein, TM1812 family [Anaerobranca californiensis DSM 14826]